MRPNAWIRTLVATAATCAGAMMFCITAPAIYASAPADSKAKDATQPGAAPAHRDSRRIDIGEIEVTGEMRKPLLDYLNSDRYMKGLLPQIAKEQMDRNEKQLLQSEMGKRVSPELRSRQEKQAESIHDLADYEKSLTENDPKRREP